MRPGPFCDTYVMPHTCDFRNLLLSVSALNRTALLLLSICWVTYSHSVLMPTPHAPQSKYKQWIDKSFTYRRSWPPGCHHSLFFVVLAWSSRALRSVVTCHFKVFVSHSSDSRHIKFFFFFCKLKTKTSRQQSQHIKLFFDIPSLPRYQPVNITNMTNTNCCEYSINPLTPNDPYRGRTAPLTSKVAF